MFASKPAYFFTTSAALLSLCRGSGSSQVGSSLHTSIIGHNTSSHLLHSQRHASIYQRLHSLTEFKLANYHADNRNKFTSKEATGGPQQGFGFDPVSSALNLERATGRLKRRHNTNPEDYLDVDETARWIDARQAAKILNIKEADLPKLTKAVLEEKWRAAYRERNFAKQEEVLIATETLLEYIDSSLHHKKSRQYYRQLIENTRMAIDAEMEEQRRSRSAITIWSVSIFFFGASIMVMFVAVSRRYVTWDDANLIGNRVSEYVNMTFMQPKNLEPKPDYHTRYFNTPTAMELDRRAGRADQQFMPVEEVRILDDKATFERKEEAEMLQLLNEENELAAAHGRVDAAAQSRVAVYRPEDLEEGDSAKASTSTTTDASLSVSRPSSTKDEPRSANNFRGFVSMMSNNFGGGSHFQRLTQETAQRSAEAEKLAERSARQKKMSESAHGSESDASN